MPSSVFTISTSSSWIFLSVISQALSHEALSLGIAAFLSKEPARQQQHHHHQPHSEGNATDKRCLSSRQERTHGSEMNLGMALTARVGVKVVTGVDREVHGSEHVLGYSLRVARGQGYARLEYAFAIGKRWIVEQRQRKALQCDKNSRLRPNESARDQCKRGPLSFSPFSLHLSLSLPPTTEQFAETRGQGMRAPAKIASQHPRNGREETESHLCQLVLAQRCFLRLVLEILEKATSGRWGCRLEVVNRHEIHGAPARPDDHANGRTCEGTGSHKERSPALSSPPRRPPK